MGIITSFIGSPQTDLTTTDVMINGDVNYLSMLINNLLGNALQYADHEISVRLEKSDKESQKWGLKSV